MLQFQTDLKLIGGSQLNALLGKKSWEVHSRLLQKDTLDNDHLKTAMLQQYNYSEQGYRQRSRKPKSKDSDQFMVRLKNYFTQWVKLSKMESNFEGVVDLMVKDQFIKSCSKELSVHLMEKKPQNLRKLVAVEKQH